MTDPQVEEAGRVAEPIEVPAEVELTADGTATATVNPISKARRRPTGSRRELVIWYMMRVTGVMLFVLALAHFSILHFIWDPAEQTADFITNERWNQIFWRGFDWLLLMTVLFHGFLGVRTVVIDYIRRPVLREFTLILLYTIGVILFIIGTQVVMTLPMPGES
jgi:succinate dehydrogenase / fumarate reductase membrane anchor subunit